MAEMDVDWEVLKQESPIPGWHRYTHPKTKILQVTPTGDTKFHMYNLSCACDPIVIEHRGDVVMIHQAADGRPGLFQEEQQMNNNENAVKKMIEVARTLVLQSDSASYQRGVIELLANQLEVDYTEAVDLIHDTKTPKNEHIILVAFHMVGPESMKQAQIETDYNSMGSLRDLRGSIYGKIQGFEFANFAEGKAFIDKMNQRIAVFGIATLNDALDLLGIEHKRFAGEKMGWSTRLDPTVSLRAIKYRYEYTLDLPTPTHKTR